MCVLVTGSNGQVGRHLVEKLQANVDLIALDREALDISDEHAVNIAIERFRPAFIINAAAYTAVDKAESETERAFAINCEGVRHLAKAAKTYDATVIHISTDYVFSGDAERPYRETDKTGPLNVYGQSKLAGEQAIIDATCKHIILRTAWVFSENGNNFVKTMLRLGATKPALGIVEDQLGGPTYAGDIADVLITIMEKLAKNDDADLYGIYHYAGYPYVNWFEFARAIFSEAEKQGILKSPALKGISSKEYPTPAARPRSSRLNTDKICENFGIKPSNWCNALTRISEYVK